MGRTSLALGTRRKVYFYSFVLLKLGDPTSDSVDTPKLLTSTPH